MRILILKGDNVPKKDVDKLTIDLADLYTRNINRQITFTIESMDFTNLPYSMYGNQGLGIDQSYLATECQTIYKKYGESIDLVIFLVHHKAWKPGLVAEGKIWGWNISKAFSGYEVEQARFDPKNPVNTFGTVYHEIMHSHDSFVLRYTGLDIRKIVKVNDWDNNVVHGEGEPYYYIRHQENQDALKAIAAPLNEAFNKRAAIYDPDKGKLLAIVGLLQKTVVLLNQLIAEQKKDIPLALNNKCICTN